MSDHERGWTRRLPMRWADLDQLNHVNNVVYVEYASEALAELALAGELPAPAAGNVTTTFLAPMTLSTTPVTIRTAVDGDVVTQEVCSGDDGETVNARVVTSPSARGDLSIPAEAGPARPLRVRTGDVDAAGSVTVPKLFELFQEARILMVFHELPVRSAGQFVVGTVGIDLVAPVVWRPEPYGARSWISRVGNASLTVETVLTDGDRPLARASSVLVGFDLDTQTSRQFGEAERAAMLERVVTG